MKELFIIHHKDKKPLYALTILFVFVNLFWAFYTDNTWDDDCPARFQNTVHALTDPHQFVSLWNRPLFIALFVFPAQLGSWTIPILQTLFSIIAGYSLYQVAKNQQLRFAYLAFPLLAFQPFVFGVSRYAMTEPLAITLICLSLFFQTKKKWNAFAICGALLPLARMELVIFFPFYAIALINAKKYLSILILGIPSLLWALAGGLLNNNLLWIIDETIGKEKKENRYGHQEWDTYLSRYAYVVGPVLMLFSFLGSFKAWKSKFLRVYTLFPFLLGFLVYTLFSWKLNMGNAAGFLRNIIPLSPFLSLICLAGITSWFAFGSKRNQKLKDCPNLKKVQATQWLKKAKSFNSKINIGKYYGLIFLIIAVCFIYFFYSNKLELHHKISKNTSDLSIFYAASILFVFSILILFLNRRILNYVFPIVIFLTLSSYTLIVEHPLANSNPERQLVSNFAKIYNNTYFKDRITHVNHPWFLWSTGRYRYDSQMKIMKKDSLKKAGVGTLALLETHYSNRLGGDVNQTFLHKQKEWIEIARYTTPKQNFILSAYEKVNGVDEYEKVHFKFIEATDSSNPTSFYCLGNTYLTKLKNLEKAYNAFGKSVQIDSTYAEGFLGLGKTMILKRNYKSAILFFNKGLENSPKNFTILLQKGIAQINMKHFNAAIKTFKKASKINSKDHNVWFYTGLAYEGQKKINEALKAYEQALKRKPTFAEAWQNVSIIQYGQKDKKSACENIKKAYKYGSTSAKRLIPQICK